jgi:hypothetical protein
MFLKFGDVAVFETLVLVFFWHAWMSFILPLLAVETWLTNSSVLLGYFPVRLQRFFNRPTGWLLIAAFGGLFVSINAKSPREALLSGLGVLTVLGIFGWLWRRLTWGRSYTLESLLPDRRELRFLIFLLAALYVFTGLFLRPEAYPSAVGHLVIWILYVFLALLFGLALRRSRFSTVQSLEGSPPQWLWIVGVLTFIIFAMLAESIFLPLSWLFMLTGWFGSALLGLMFFLRFTWLLFKKKPLESVLKMVE